MGGPAVFIIVWATWLTVCSGAGRGTTVPSIVRCGRADLTAAVVIQRQLRAEVTNVSGRACSLSSELPIALAGVPQFVGM
jgi:hypothetical protein